MTKLVLLNFDRLTVSSVSRSFLGLVLAAILALASIPKPERDSHAFSIEEHIAAPGLWDRVMALAFFFQAAAFIRALTPRVLSQVSDSEVKFLALCLGLDPDQPPTQE